MFKSLESVAPCLPAGKLDELLDDLVVGQHLGLERAFYVERKVLRFQGNLGADRDACRFVGAVLSEIDQDGADVGEGRRGLLGVDQPQPQLVIFHGLADHVICAVAYLLADRLYSEHQSWVLQTTVENHVELY